MDKNITEDAERLIGFIHPLWHLPSEDMCIIVDRTIQKWWYPLTTIGNNYLLPIFQIILSLLFPLFAIKVSSHRISVCVSYRECDTAKGQRQKKVKKATERQEIDIFHFLPINQSRICSLFSHLCLICLISLTLKLHNFCNLPTHKQVPRTIS